MKFKNKNIVLVDESYNSNPLSLKVAIENFDNIKLKKSKKYLILGDMLELGKHSVKQHRLISKIINKTKINKVYVYGKYIKETFKGKKMAPAFNAFHTFLYTPNEVTSSGTHVKVADDLKRTMNTVIMSLVPCLIFGIFNAGYQHNLAIDAANGIYTQASFFGNFLTFENLMIGSMKVLPLVIVSYVVGLTVEFIFAVIKGHEVEEGYLVTGMLVPLIVPVDLPLWMLAVSVVFGVVIGKEVFGGTGMNILNVALTARVFLYFGFLGATWNSFRCIALVLLR